MKRKRIAIVGAGLSGSAVAVQLVRQRPAPDVVLIERTARFGQGLAYSTPDRGHLLNVRASNISMLADEPEHFACWLSAQNGGAPTAFAPRASYGAYVADTLRRARNRRLFGRAIFRVRDDVVGCTRGGEHWSLECASGKTIEADAVVLATGHQPPSTLPVFTESGVETIGAWDSNGLKRLSQGDVLLLGAGLTMIDVALSLSRRRKGTIYALSRRGLIPRPQLDPPRPAPTAELELPINLSDAVRVFRREVEAMAERGEPWQLAVDRMRHHTQDYWQRLPLEAQRRFLRHLRPWWDVHRHRMAPDIAERVAALMAQGRLRVLAGEIVSASPHARGVVVQHRQRGSMVRHRLDVAGVVNCTGGNLDVTRAEDRLLNQLLRAGLARPHRNGIGIDLDAESRVVDKDGNAHQTLFAIGPITQGAFWESTSVLEIREWARAVAEHLA